MLHTRAPELCAFCLAKLHQLATTLASSWRGADALNKDGDHVGSGCVYLPAYFISQVYSK
jgi:hypothetical protein